MAEEKLARFSYAIYEKDDQSFQVIQYKDWKTGERFVATGRELPTKKNLLVHLFGDWVQNPKDGKTVLKVSYTDIARQDDKDGIIAYFSSLKCGVGKIKAEKIYDAFGDSTWDILRDSPWRIKEVTGIGATLGDKIEKAVAGSFALRAIMQLFAGANAAVPPTAITAYIKHATDPLKTIKANPYGAMQYGVSFEAADALADKLGIPPTDQFRVRAFTLKVLANAAVKGHVCIPAEELLDSFEKELNLDREVSKEALKKELKLAFIRATNGKIYSAQSYEEEIEIAADVKRLMKSKKEYKDEMLDGLLDDYEKETGITLADNQRLAVKKSFSSPVSIITGGPGTGKTTVIKALLYCHKKAFKDFAPVLLAPTGRAARRMSDATGYPAQTIHSAVGYKGEDIETDESEIEGNLIVVDESSMMDQFIASTLFWKVKDGSRIVLVGDPDQLPSVGAGNVLADMIRSKKVTVTKLEVIFRQAEDNPIIQNAAKINHGDPRLILGKSFKFMECQGEDVIQAAVDLYCRCANAYGIDNVVLLNPQRNNTQISVDVFNKLLQEKINPAAPGKSELSIGKMTFRQGDRVMQTKNTEDAKNGDVGYIKEIRHKPSKDDPDTWIYEAEIEFGGDGIIHTYGMDDLKQLDLAYCCTVHKSQGQEYDTVIEIVSSEHRSMLKRTLVYTGITRAKKNVALIGDRAAFVTAVKNDRAEKRYTNLAQRLYAAL